MYSVTTEVPASLSLPTAPPKAARPDQSVGTDSFGALVDSTAASSTKDRAGPGAQQSSASQRRTDDTAASADNTRPRDAAPADQDPGTASSDRQTDAGQVSDGNAKADASASTDASHKTKAKASGSNSDDDKSSTKAASDAPATTDAAALALQVGAPVTTPIPVAVAIPVPNAAADAPAATSGNATAPLAIAAAAIAATAPATAASVASPAQIKIDSTPAATPASVATAPSAAVPANPAAAAPAAQIAVAASATAATAVAPSARQEPTPMAVAAATDTAPTMAVAATAPVQPKITPLKDLAAAPAKAPASGASDTTVGTANPSPTATSAGIATSNNLAQQPTSAAKPETGTGIVDTGKSDDSAGPGSTAAAAKPGDDRSPVTGMAQALTASPDAGAQANATIQPPLSSAATQAAAVVPPLTVTAAINAPVPLSGLALELAASARSGKSRFEIRLDPADLGRIDVRIDVDRNGQVTSHLRVEKPETLSMLRQDAPQLQRALDDAGFKTGNGGLQFSLRDQSSSGQNSGNETGRNAQRLVVSEEDTIPAAVAGRTYGRMLGSSSGVDISV